MATTVGHRLPSLTDTEEWEPMRMLLRGVVYHLKNRTLLTRLRHGPLPSARPAQTPSSRRLNALHDGMPMCTSYLEVGVEHGHTFVNVNVPFSWGVDPHPRFDVSRIPPGSRFSVARSDDFFTDLNPQTKFDLVFLDGLHEWRQTYRDLLSALEHTASHAVIVIDDVVPDDVHSALPDQAAAIEQKLAAGINDYRWQGDVFKVVLAIQRAHPELEFRVLTTDEAGDNPQAVVWKGRERFAPLITEKELEAELQDIGYADTFIGGRTPSGFRPIEEAAGITAAIMGSHAAWRDGLAGRVAG